MKKSYSTPAVEFLEIKINDVCQAASPTENPLDKWVDGETIGGNI